MSFPTIKLGDCCTKIGSGATPKGGKNVYVDRGVKQIRSQNVRNLEFDYSGLVSITDEAAEKLKGVTVFPDDILLNITGDSVARVCQVPDEVIPARVNQHVAIIRARQEMINPDFIAYYLASPYMQSYMLQLANGKGASRNALTKDMIACFEVPCPDLSVQKKILETIKPYDKLIENNRRQIKLLEEAAQRLYKEWFVDLLFPGHENVVICDGLPEGWRLCSLLDEVGFVRGRSYAADDLQDDGELSLVNLNNVASYGGWNSGAEKGYSGAFKKEQLVVGGDVIMAVTDMTKERRLVGHVARVPKNSAGSVISMDLIKLLPRAVDPNYLYAYLRFSGVAEMIAMLANGTNVIHLKPDALVRANVVIPTCDVQEKYANKVQPIFEVIEKAEEQIKAAREARDRLLPKLMSGEIEV